MNVLTINAAIKMLKDQRGFNELTQRRRRTKIIGQATLVL